jgi:hypothetical protein
MIDLPAQIKEAKRALALRKHLFPTWVRNGTLSARDADDRMEAMEAIVRTLMRLEGEQRQLPLFAQEP